MSGNKQKVTITRTHDHDEGDYSFFIDYDPGERVGTLRIFNALREIEEFRAVKDEFKSLPFYDYDSNQFMVISGKTLDKSGTSWELVIEWKDFRLL
jgi:hypothetical protein